MKLPFAVKWTMAGLVTIIVVLSLAWVFRSCRKDPGKKIPPELQKSIDSLESTKKGFDKAKDSIVTIIIHDTVHATAKNKEAEQLRSIAVGLHEVADSFAQIAREHSDSAALWQAAYEKQKQEADALRIAYAKKDSAYQFEANARRALMTLYVADTLRRRAEEDAKNKLIRRIAELEVPCRIVGPIKCPSRTVTMVLTTVTVAVAQNAVKR